MNGEMLPLLVFTTCAGLAAGAYVVDAFCGGEGGRRMRLAKACSGEDGEGAGGERMCSMDGERAGSASGRFAKVRLLPLVCLALLAVGLCGTLAHLGQPLRFLNGMANPASGISQESYWAIGLGAVMAVDFVLSWGRGVTARPVRWLGAAAACGLMVVTGLAYYDCLGLEAWRGAVTVPLFVVGDVALGAGLCALLDVEGLAYGRLACANVAAGIALAIVLLAYGLYLARLGIDMNALLVAAGIVGPVGAGATAAAAGAGKVPVRAGGIAVCALAVVGAVLARGAFFAAGLL